MRHVDYVIVGNCWVGVGLSRSRVHGAAAALPLCPYWGHFAADHGQQGDGLSWSGLGLRVFKWRRMHAYVDPWILTTVIVRTNGKDSTHTHQTKQR